MTSLNLLLALLLAHAAHALPSQKGAAARSERSPGAVQPTKQDSTMEDMVAQQSSLSEVELVAGDEDEDEAEGGDVVGDTEGESQHFFPSFAPLFSNSPLGRPPLFDDHPRGFSDNYRSLYSSEEGVLGSGNFGVLRGGTYYSGHGDEEYNGHSGRGGYGGRGSNPAPPYRHGGDFFAGFRDFADITTPPKSAYSHYVVVYANPKSKEREGTVVVANNILEQLALLDRRPPTKKTSKAKQKLALYKEASGAAEARKKNKSPKDLTEPLLALS